jgi:hypothetical protein
MITKPTATPLFFTFGLGAGKGQLPNGVRAGLEIVDIGPPRPEVPFRGVSLATQKGGHGGELGHLLATSHESYERRARASDNSRGQKRSWVDTKDKYKEKARSKQTESDTTNQSDLNIKAM